MTIIIQFRKLFVVSSFLITLFLILCITPLISLATPLITAIQNNDTKLAQLLIKKGANVNERDENGHFTPLSYAVGFGNEKIVIELLDAGAEPNPLDVNGNTPLDEAIRRKHKSIVKILETFSKIKQENSKSFPLSLDNVFFIQGNGSISRFKQNEAKLVLPSKLDLEVGNSKGSISGQVKYHAARGQFIYADKLVVSKEDRRELSVTCTNFFSPWQSYSLEASLSADKKVIKDLWRLVPEDARGSCDKSRLVYGKCVADSCIEYTPSSMLLTTNRELAFVIAKERQKKIISTLKKVSDLVETNTPKYNECYNKVSERLIRCSVGSSCDITGCQNDATCYGDAHWISSFTCTRAINSSYTKIRGDTYCDIDSRKFDKNKEKLINSICK